MVRSIVGGLVICVMTLAPAALAGEGAHAKNHEKLVRIYDVDGDGKLDGTEKASLKADRGARRAHVLARFDADKDGTLSGPERAVAKEAKRSEHAQKKQERLARFDANKDKKIDDNERAAAKRNKNGRVDGKDLAASRAAASARIRGE